MILQHFSKQIQFSRTFQESTIYSSSFRFHANPELGSILDWWGWGEGGDGMEHWFKYEP